MDYRTMRCDQCAAGWHERCEGWVVSRCECYCQDLEDDDG